mgnify:CR=1 FL=1
MKIIGITGGVGSGKSRVLSFLEEKYKAVICQADHVAWKLQEPGQKSYIDIVEYFGKSILNENQTINRGLLGKIVFNDVTKLQKLNEITHPAVKNYIKEQINIEKEKGSQFFIIEAALLLEDHYDEICDEIWYIHTDVEKRIQRLMSSRGYTREKAVSIINNQASEEFFRSHADCVIENKKDARLIV